MLDIYLQLPSTRRSYCISYDPSHDIDAHSHIKRIVLARFLGLNLDVGSSLFYALGPFVQMDQPNEVEIELWKADDSTIDGQDHILNAVFSLAEVVGGNFKDIIKDSSEWARLER